MRRMDNIEELIEKSYLENLDFPVDTEMDMRILSDAVARMEETKKKRLVNIKPALWRMIMKNRRTHHGAYWYTLSGRLD
jgi:hypothetical protein